MKRNLNFDSLEGRRTPSYVNFTPLVVDPHDQWWDFQVEISNLQRQFNVDRDLLPEHIPNTSPIPTVTTPEQKLEWQDVIEYLRMTRPPN